MTTTDNRTAVIEEIGTGKELQFSPSYNARDIEIVKAAHAFMAANNFKQAALARLVRIAASTLSLVLTGTYPTSPSKMLESLEAAMRNINETSKDSVTAVETSVFKLAQASCTMARRNRNFAVFSSFVGTGKTFGLKHYAKHHSNTYMIEADPTMTAGALLKTLARAVIGYETRGGVAVQMEAVINALRDTDTLLVIDEAETLTPKQLHLLRRIRDKANIGIVLAGTEWLNKIIAPMHGQFDQIRSRTGFWPPTVKHISKDDAYALIQSGFGTEEVSEDVMARLFAYSQGSARMLVEGLITGIHQFRKDNPLNTALVDEVAVKALCLQVIK